MDAEEEDGGAGPGGSNDEEEEEIYGESTAFSLLALLSLHAHLAHPPFSPLLSSL